MAEWEDRNSEGPAKGSLPLSSERETIEDELEKLRRLHELILNSSGEGIFGLDLEGRTTFVNPAVSEILGWKPDELMGNLQHSLIHHTRPNGTSYPKEECHIYATFEGGKVHRIDDEVFWRKDGSSVPVEYVSTPMRDDRGRLVGAVVTFRDISERKRAEEDIRNLAKFPAENPNPVIRVSDEGAVTYANEASQFLLEEWGCGKDRILARKWRSYISDVFNSNQSKECEVVCENRTISILSIPVRESGYVYVYGRDITQRKKAEEALKEAHDELENRVREQTADLLQEIAEHRKTAWSARPRCRSP